LNGDSASRPVSDVGVDSSEISSSDHEFRRRRLSNLGKVAKPQSGGIAKRRKTVGINVGIARFPREFQGNSGEKPAKKNFLKIFQENACNAVALRVTYELSS
jgi:hypothetical protein